MHQQFLHEVAFFHGHPFAVKTIQRTDKTVIAIVDNDGRSVEIRLP